MQCPLVPGAHCTTGDCVPDNHDFLMGEMSGQLKEHDKVLRRIETTLDKNTETLVHHVQRTNLAEENIAMLRQSFKPVEEHVVFVRRLGRLVITLAGLAVTLLTLLGLLR